jgi:hypothetical protein
MYRTYGSHSIHYHSINGLKPPDIIGISRWAEATPLYVPGLKRHFNKFFLVGFLKQLSLHLRLCGAEDDLPY